MMDTISTGNLPPEGLPVISVVNNNASVVKRVRKTM